MADVNANIGVNIDTSNALAQIKNLQRQLSEFYTSISRSSATAALAQRDLQRNLVNSINSLGGFSAELRTIKTTAESFTNSLEKNKFSMREYFRYAAASTKTFSRVFSSEFDTINKVAEDNVKRLQTQYIKLGRDANGAMKAIAVIPTELNMKDFSVQTQMASQRQAIFNQLIKQGSTNLLNFGKNTQWAGRQLMVGFTIPLTLLGNVAAKTFMEMETAAIKFKKVYGDMFTPAAETQAALDNVKELGVAFTRYGIAVKDTVSLAADAAAAGFQGLDLQRQVTEATRLQVLGQIDQQKALETTISLQNAFQMSSEDLSDSINFLNAVENQTVVSLDDITTAIPKAAPVVKQLGGSVKDLAFFMAAMKEGGINASEGANALKSGLASLINPTDKAREMMAGFGIDIDAIVNKNAGNVKQTVIEFAMALDNLSDLNRQRAIEQLFGKFQLARLSTLFENVTRSGNQASRVLDLATASTGDLAAMADKELGMTAESAMNKFRASVEQLKLALVPVGEVFLQTVTPIVDVVSNVLDAFNDLSPGVKKAITVMTVAIGGIGPVALMTFGLLNNGIANAIKLFTTLRNGYLRLTGQSQILGEQTQLLTTEQQNAAAVAHSLDQSHARLTQTFNVEKAALDGLVGAYARATTAAQNFIIQNPGMMLPGRMPKRYAKGVSLVPGSGSGDTVPAMLEPGEAVIPKAMAKKYAPLINAMVAGNIPGYRKGLGTGTAVDIPGGYAAAHFGGSSYRSGSELLQMVEGLDTAFARQIRTMVAEVENGLDRVFTVFSNEVVSMSTELNRAVGKTGSGKRASVDLARTELTTGAYAQTRDIELQRQLEAAGVSIEDIRQINKKITEEITTGFGRLGDITEVTAEDLDKLIGDAYKAVAKTDARVDQAYKNMQNITTVTNPLNDSRIAVTNDPYTKARKSGKYYGGMTRMVGEGNVPYQANARFKISNAMAGSLGLSSQDAAAIYNKFSNEVKVRLASLRKDITAFTVEFEKQAELAGIKTGNAYKVGLDKNLRDVYVESRQRQSPHPMASKDGTDDGNAYETARQNAIKQRRVATSPGGTVGPGGVIIPPMPPVIPGGAEGPMYGPRKPTFVDKTFGRFRGRFGGMASNPAVGMAASTAFFAASMMPGKVGEVAQKAMPAVFGLQALQMALKLPIPHIKAFAAVALAGVGIFKLVNSQLEKSRLAIEGLGDAATLTSDKAKTLGNFFGVAPQSTRLERSALGSGRSVMVDSQTRTQLDALRADEGFQKDFAKDIQSLKNASSKQAELVLNSLAIQLKGKGFAKEQIDLIIKALQEESGKTNLKISFADIDLSTAEGQAKLKQSVTALTRSFGKEFKKGYESETKTAVSGATGEIVTWTEEKLSKGLKKSVSTASKAIAGMFNGLSGQLENGSISLDQFNQGFDSIIQSIQSMPQPQSALLMQNIFKNMPGDIAKAAGEIKNFSTQALLAKAALLGVETITKTMINALKTAETSSDGGAQRAATRVKAKIKKDTDAVAAGMKAMAEAAKKAFGDLGGAGTGEDSPFVKLKKQLQEAITNAQNSSRAFNLMRQNGVGIAEALELSKDPLLAMVLATTKSKKEFNTILKLIREMNKETEKGALKNFLQGLKAKNNLTEEFTKVMPLLQKMGLKSEEIMDILNNADVARGLINGLNQAKDKAAFLKNYIDEIVRERTLRINIEMNTVEGKVNKVTSIAGAQIRSLDARAAVIRRAAQTGSYGGDFSKLSGLNAEQMAKLSKINLGASQAAVTAARNQVTQQQSIIAGIQSQINAKQHLISLNNALIDKQQQEIDKIDKLIDKEQERLKAAEEYVKLNFDEPLQKLNDESNVLSNRLSQIERQEKAINEQYDKQQKAMEEMNKLNEEAIQQGKTRISIADALSQGDISAAAQGVQDLRSQQAESQSGAMQAAMDAARQQALGSIAVDGMTRAQIEERQYQIQQESFKLEQAKAEYIRNTVLPIQKEIERLEASKIPFQNEINRLTEANAAIQREIEDIQNNQLYAAEQTLDKLEGQLDAAEDKLAADEAIVEEIIKQLEESGKTKEEWEKIVEEAEAALAKFNAIQASLEAGENAAAGIKAILDSINGMVYTVTIVQNVVTVGGTVGSTGSSGSTSSSGSTVTGTTTVDGRTVVTGTSTTEDAHLSALAGASTVNGTKVVDGRTVITGTSSSGSDIYPSYSVYGAFSAKKYGGKILKRAIGGIVPGIGLSDKVPTLLTPGEFVINKASAQAFGPMLESINQMQYPQMATNRGLRTATQKAADIALQNSVALSKGGYSDNSSEVYNYKVDVNVMGSSSNPDEIANAVMNKIRQLESTTLRGRRV